MSNKYKRRTDVLKEHKQDKDHKYHHTRKKSNYSRRKAKTQKKDYNDFKKKIEKSKKIW